MSSLDDTLPKVIVEGCTPQVQRACVAVWEQHVGQPPFVPLVSLRLRGRSVEMLTGEGWKWIGEID